MARIARGFVLGVLSVSGESAVPFPPAPPGLTTFQKDMLQWAAPIAAAASKEAEAELLEMFASKKYKNEIDRLGDASLASLSPEESLAKLKVALETVEYGTTFGIGPAQRAKQPGMASPNVSTIDDWGFYPNPWQLAYYNSSLEKGMTDNQWNLYTGGEVGLYHLKAFPPGTNYRPTWEETAERPTYVTINNRRLDAGNEAFGEYTMVYRGNVLKDRTVIISADSGEWQNACNKSIHTKRAWYWSVMEKLFYHCQDMGGAPDWNKPDWHPTPARPGMELHTIVQQAKLISQSLPRLIGQMLSPNAVVEPLEMMFYSEAAVLGAVTMSDLKFMLASFAIFGTPDGDNVIAFCRKNSLPLLWARGWPLGASVQHFWNALPPPFGKPTIPAGRARIMDISTAAFTSDGKAPSSAAQAAWKQVEDEVRTYKNGIKAPPADQIDTWWAQLGQVPANVHVLPIRGAECPSTDLCFGVDATHACVCRKDPDEVSAAVMI